MSEKDLIRLNVGFKTTCTVVWCADHTALCGPHAHSRLKNYPTTTISPQYILLTFFIKFFGKKNFQKFFKKISRFFFKILKKSIQMNCGGGVPVWTTPNLKNLWLCGPPRLVLIPSFGLIIIPHMDQGNF